MNLVKRIWVWAWQFMGSDVIEIDRDEQIKSQVAARRERLLAKVS